MTIERPAGVTRAALLGALLVFGLTACRRSPRRGRTWPALTHGTAVGEVVATSAVVWGRCDRAAALHVRLGDDERRPRRRRRRGHRLHRQDRPRAISPPIPRYAYRAWCGDALAAGAATAGFAPRRMPTPPPAVRFVWGGDVGGQNVCRDRARGYPIFDRDRGAARPISSSASAT